MKNSVLFAALVVGLAWALIGVYAFSQQNKSDISAVLGIGPIDKTAEQDIPVSSTATPSPTVPPSALGYDERGLLAAINDLRAQAGVGPLQVSPILTTVAVEQAQRTSANGISGGSRLVRISAGYPATARGVELSAWGTKDPDATVLQWAASPDHRAELVNPNYLVVGIASIETPSGVPLWVVDLGNYNDNTS